MDFFKIISLRKKSYFFIILSIISFFLFHVAFLKNNHFEKSINVALSLSDSSTTHTLLLWEEKIQPYDIMIEHLVQPKETLWGILKKYDLTLDPLLRKTILSVKSESSCVLKKLKPGNRFFFIIRDQSVVKFILGTEKNEFLFKNNGVKDLTLHSVLQPSLSYTKREFSLMNGIFKDLSAAQVPPKLIQLVTNILSQRINLKKEIIPGTEFRLLYSVDEKDNITLYKFSFDNGKRFFRGYYFPYRSCNFFDQDGRAFKKTFLEKPVDDSRITSHFSLARKHPVLGVVRAHKGVDFAAKKGSPVKVTADGVISYLGVKGGYGNVIEVYHDPGMKTVYAHLDGFAKKMRKGRAVQQGEIIGYVGMTGLATGPHLHYEYHLNGVPIDPLKLSVPKYEPLPANQLIEFTKQMLIIDALDATVALEHDVNQSVIKKLQ
jgi:murein DD-endopeptidase MepM/ murein hydrolase activator NlpD